VFWFSSRLPHCDRLAHGPSIKHDRSSCNRQTDRRTDKRFAMLSTFWESTEMHPSSVRHHIRHYSNDKRLRASSSSSSTSILITRTDQLCNRWLLSCLLLTYSLNRTFDDATPSYFTRNVSQDVNEKKYLCAMPSSHNYSQSSVATYGVLGYSPQASFLL